MLVIVDLLDWKYSQKCLYFSIHGDPIASSLPLSSSLSSSSSSSVSAQWRLSVWKYSETEASSSSSSSSQKSLSLHLFNDLFHHIDGYFLSQSGEMLSAVSLWSLLTSIYCDHCLHPFIHHFIHLSVHLYNHLFMYPSIILAMYAIHLSIIYQSINTSHLHISIAMNRSEWNRYRHRCSIFHTRWLAS